MRGREGPPDKRLFRRAREGDRRAYLQLLRRYDPRLRCLVLRLVAEPERVDPILRRAYVRAWRSLAAVQPPGSVAEWLYRVVYNACVNELRWAPERPPPPAATGPRVPLPVAAAERRLAGLRALTPEERIPLALVDGEGFTLEATARILQRPPVVVAADLSRARSRWRGFVVGDDGRTTDAPEVVELEPTPGEVEKAAVDEKPEPLALQRRHVRVVTPTEGNGDEDGSDLTTAPPPDAPPAPTPSPTSSPPSPLSGPVLAAVPDQPTADAPPPAATAPAAPATGALVDDPDASGDGHSRRAQADTAAAPSDAPTGERAPSAGSKPTDTVGGAARGKGQRRAGSAPSPGSPPPAAPNPPDSSGSGQADRDGDVDVTDRPGQPASDGSASDVRVVPAGGGSAGGQQPSSRAAGSGTGTGSGARRKRRREAKRDGRRRSSTGGAQGGTNEAGEAETAADTQPAADDQNEAS